MKASRSWSPRFPTPIQPRRIRSLAPRTREADAAVSAVSAPAAVRVKVRRLIFEDMRDTPSVLRQASAFEAHRFAEFAGLARDVGLGGISHFPDHAVDLAAAPLEFGLALILRHVAVRHRRLLESKVGSNAAIVEQQ